MYDRHFFSTRLGKAALASTAAMALFVVFSTHITLTVPTAQLSLAQPAELA